VVILQGSKLGRCHDKVSLPYWTLENSAFHMTFVANVILRAGRRAAISGGAGSHLGQGGQRRRPCFEVRLVGGWGGWLRRPFLRTASSEAPPTPGPRPPSSLPPSMCATAGRTIRDRLLMERGHGQVGRVAGGRWLPGRLT
jgi:hypothetical protein